jgi:hypothetical protein
VRQPGPVTPATPALTPWCGVSEVVVEALLLVRLGLTVRELAYAVTDYRNHRAARRELAAREAQRLRALADALVDAGEQLAGAGADLADDLDAGHA